MVWLDCEYEYPYKSSCFKVADVGSGGIWKNPTPRLLHGFGRHSQYQLGTTRSPIFWPLDLTSLHSDPNEGEAFHRVMRMLCFSRHSAKDIQLASCHTSQDQTQYPSRRLPVNSTDRKGV